LYQVRSIEGVDWAVPMYRGLLRCRFRDGNYQSCYVIGIDDATLIGGPPIMVEGDISDLRRPDSVIINDVGAKSRLKYFPPNATSPAPVQIGEVFEINDRRARIFGICKIQRTFRSEPVLYTTYSRALAYAPSERQLLCFVLVKAQKGVSKEELSERIRSRTGYAAYSANEFKRLTIDYYVRNTGILINFGFAVFLGFIIGIAISGQTFYNFALDNLRYFAIYKAMGASQKVLRNMIWIQALFVGFLGYGIGIGLTTLFGIASSGTELSFNFPWALYLGSFICVFLIILFSALLSLRKIERLDPAIVFQQ
jgi:putative ABC transport system permease protein